jgi:hypothetical protein
LAEINRKIILYRFLEMMRVSRAMSGFPRFANLVMTSAIFLAPAFFEALMQHPEIS